ncbi:hypothetical protein B0I08_101393 [Glaciihabitans tibetensis]|uniref:Type III secretion system (T3SS) SseB-like protein n=1 Tax=Glaciihabitans tibetensis TaxID=1266600 RepID=A0A2T0VJ69_9MICO|nr:hypothetical protein [Glaciihabitans tibetensis]PRY70263.1 hypothetical protein B0I08_101393 [Glaciihabitans tibetensis]
MTDPTNSTPDSQNPTPVPVAALPEVGSVPLLAALIARDVEAIGRALRMDYVVVPLLRREDGTVDTRVFGRASSTPDNPEWALCLFSSTETLAAFIGEVPDREFALQRGSSLAPFLAEQVESLSAVSFDPASPHAMTASPADVLEILQPRPEDDEVAWATSGADDARSLPDFPADGDATASRVAGFDLALSGDWFLVNLLDEVEREKQIAALIDRQLKKVKAAPVLRAELAAWLTESCVRAAAGGAQFLAYLLQRSKKGALALNVVLYWQELGPAVSTISHLDRMGDKLHRSLTEGAQLVGADTPGGPLLRHSRTIAGPGELGAGNVPLLLTDYWLEFPDHRGLCLVAFSSPVIAQADLLLTLTDNIVLSGAWVVDTPAEELPE